MTRENFPEKVNQPDESELKKAIGKSYNQWLELKNFVIRHYPKAVEQWDVSKLKFGWSLRIRDKKRALIYLIPCEGFFKAGMVFGEKATVEARNSNLSEAMMKIIESAPVYAEGRGFRIDMHDNRFTDDMKKLILIKLKY